MNFKFQEIRRKKGITQAELAKRLGTHRSDVSKIKNAERELSIKGFVYNFRVSEVNPIATIKSIFKI
jgi:transcriptional regulator with XRE-family HTH domain